MKTTTTTLALTCMLAGCGAEDPEDPVPGPSTSASTSGAGGTASVSTSSTGGMGGMGGTGGQGGAGGAPCILQSANLLDLDAPHEPPGMPFEHTAASIDPQAAVASMPGSPRHHCDFAPNFGSNNSAAVTIELTCHRSSTPDLELSVVRGRFQSGGWTYQSEGQPVSCGQSASFTINKPPGPEPSYFYRVAFVDGAPDQAVPYTIGAAQAYAGPPAACIDPATVIVPPGDDIPTESGALSAQSGTITLPFGNTHDFIRDPALVGFTQTEVVTASLSCSSPHLELHLVTVGDNGQLRMANRINSQDQTIDCGEQSAFGISAMSGQTDWFALVAPKPTYDPAVDGPLAIPYSVDIQ